MGVLVFAVIAVNVMAAQQSGSASRENRTVRSDSTPAAQAEVATRPADNNLPVRRVVLYKSGVGFFEHQGQIQGNQTVSVDFTNGQLDDVLQSLTLLDLNGGRIAGVDYNSEAPLSQRLGTLDLPLGEKTDIAQFYGALRGVRLQIKGSSGAITGRLLSMERKTRVSGGTTLEVDLATVVSDSGEVRTVEITPAVSVQVAERDVSQKIGQYLSLLSSAREQELRRLNVATLGTGNRQLYLSDTPDARVNEAFSWAELSIDQMRFKLGAETGLAAGWAASGELARPGFGWFFGRDTLWSLFAIDSYGDFALAREALEFLIARQRSDGKMMHEFSQTSNEVDWAAMPYFYASADSTPLFIIAIADYVRRSADLEFLRENWASVMRAY